MLLVSACTSSGESAPTTASGVATTSTAVAAQDGLVVLAAEDSIRLGVPEGAPVPGVDITISATEAPGAATDAAEVVGSFRLEPAGSNFDEPLIVETRFPAPPGGPEGTVPAYQLWISDDGTSYTPLDAVSVTVDGGEVAVSGSVPHFTWLQATRIEGAFFEFEGLPRRGATLGSRVIPMAVGESLTFGATLVGPGAEVLDANFALEPLRGEALERDSLRASFTLTCEEEGLVTHDLEVRDAEGKAISTSKVILECGEVLSDADRAGPVTSAAIQGVYSRHSPVTAIAAGPPDFYTTEFPLFEDEPVLQVIDKAAVDGKLWLAVAGPGEELDQNGFPADTGRILVVDEEMGEITTIEGVPNRDADDDALVAFDGAVLVGFAQDPDIEAPPNTLRAVGRIFQADGLARIGDVGREGVDLVETTEDSVWLSDDFNRRATRVDAATGGTQTFEGFSGSMTAGDGVVWSAAGAVGLQRLDLTVDPPAVTTVVGVDAMAAGFGAGQVNQFRDPDGFIAPLIVGDYVFVVHRASQRVVWYDTRKQPGEDGAHGVLVPAACAGGACVPGQGGIHYGSGGDDPVAGGHGLVFRNRTNGYTGITIDPEVGPKLIDVEIPITVDTEFRSECGWVVAHQQLPDARAVVLDPGDLEVVHEFGSDRLAGGELQCFDGSLWVVSPDGGMERVGEEGADPGLLGRYSALCESASAGWGISEDGSTLIRFDG